MERKRRLAGPNGPVNGTEIGFRALGEHWNEYLLDDGTVVRIKTVVTGVVRLDDQYDDEGNPGYMVQSVNVTSVSAPEELRRQEP